MARMHSKKRGKSGSKRPPVRTTPEWVEYSAHEVEDMISKFAKEGQTPTQIGMRLRDSYGVPSVKNLTKKSINKILEAGNARPQYPDDLLALIKRAVNMRQHLKSNKGDKHNRVKLIHVESKINRLVKYYTASGRMPADWVYEHDKAALIVK
jgi:small subunit ribosomal protein S15